MAYWTKADKANNGGNYAAGVAVGLLREMWERGGIRRERDDEQYAAATRKMIDVLLARALKGFWPSDQNRVERFDIADANPRTEEAWIQMMFRGLVMADYAKELNFSNDIFYKLTTKGKQKFLGLAGLSAAEQLAFDGEIAFQEGMRAGFLERKEENGKEIVEGTQKLRVMLRRIQDNS
ncbi:MAG: hypothetical protein KGH98_03775, partial [Candidatus Micrarchaeota archaeon]|nr:hypothetical protein [Candidatus Micrarchaeota archaeon]